MNSSTQQLYHVGKYDKSGKRIATIGGMGRNKGTWDHTHSRRAAQRHAATCRKDDPAHVYKAEPAYY